MKKEATEDDPKLVVADQNSDVVHGLARFKKNRKHMIVLDCDLAIKTMLRMINAIPIITKCIVNRGLK